MLLKTKILCFATLLMLCPLPAQADPFEGGSVKSNYFYKQLDNYSVSKKPAMYILERITEKLKKDPAVLPVAYEWIKVMTDEQHRAPDQVNSLFWMLRSDLAHKSAKELKRNNPAYKEFGLDALNSIMLFEMMLMADAARCANPDFVGSIVSDLLGPRYDTLGQYVYSLQPPDEMPLVWNDALRAEATMKNRQPNAEICSNGALIGLMIMDGMPKDKVPAPATPAYVDEKAWDEARDQLRYSIKDFWKERYENRTQRAIKK